MFKLIRKILGILIFLFAIYVLLCTFPFFSMPFEEFLTKIWHGVCVIAGTLYRLIKGAME